MDMDGPKLCNKSTAITEMGDRLATIDIGRKVRGCCTPFWENRRPEAEVIAGHKHRREMARHVLPNNYFRGYERHEYSSVYIIQG